MGKSFKLRCLIVLLALAVLGLGTNAMAELGKDPNPEGKQSAGKPFSGKSFGTQVARGFMNIGFCWLEVPYQIKLRLTDPDLNPPDAVLPQVYNVICGTADGVVKTADRLTGGVIEVIFSPFPSYGPLMDPAYPPYLLFMNRPQAGPTAVKAAAGQTK